MLQHPFKNWNLTHLMNWILYSNLHKQFTINKWVMLTGALKEMFNNPFWESFGISFMRNEKNCQNINYFFFFFIKIF